MSSLTILSLIILYPLSLLGDACILMAIALAATVGGRAIVWGASFAFFHALYGVLGMLMAAEVADYSEKLGDLFVLLGALVLLRHFTHHSLHHFKGGDCSCDNHKPISVKTSAIISTASALSLHALASGAIVRNTASNISTSSLVMILLMISIVVGLVIAGIVRIGESQRIAILKALDTLPGIVTAALTALCCASVYHLMSNLITSSTALSIVFIAGSALLSIFSGYTVRARRLKQPSSPLTTISPRTTSKQDLG